MKILKKTVLGVLLLATSLSAEVTNIAVTPAFINNTKLKIIDIRTQGEWIETGIVRGSYTITFFDERGNYNIDSFLAKLNAVVDKDEKFALICRTGSRTGMISNFLGKKLNYHVVNLKGGIMKLFREGFEPEFYAPNKK
jgi:rhodanese-related sulfurtransferase